MERYDLSNYLIHFVREIDVRHDFNSEMYPIEFGLGEIVESDRLSPFFILRRIIRKSQMIAGWSYRKGARTIYGKYPAVCFTEMPIADFVKSSIYRMRKGEKISNYGIVFDKKQLFNLGARPVIYGTSTPIKNSINDTGDRLLNPEIFHENELYRFVYFNLNREPRPIDWSHEREWRWPNYKYKYYNINGYDEDNKCLYQLYNKRENDRIEFHGLNLDKEKLSNIGIIVKSEKQSQQILRDILYLIDSGKINKDLYGYILRFPKLIEDIDILHKSSKLNEHIEKSRILIDKYFEISNEEVNYVEEKLKNVVNKYENYYPYSSFEEGPGISFPCIRFNHLKTARVLIHLGLVKITSQGRYLLDLSSICNRYSSLTTNEKIARKLAKDLEKIFKEPFTYYSIYKMNAQDISEISIDDVPYYTTFEEEEDLENNFADREEDF